jgi:hypothetical protein
MNVKRITGGLAKSGLEELLGVRPEHLKPLAQTIARLDRDGHLMGYQNNIKAKMPQAKRLTAENRHDLIETAITRPIAQGFKTLVKLVKDSLIKYIDDVKLQLMINKDRRDEKRRLLQMLHGELKHIKKVERANARLTRQEAKARSKAHKEGQKYYTSLKGEVDTHLTTHDNARIAHANKSGQFLEEQQRLQAHEIKQQRFDNLTRGEDTWTESNNADIEAANWANRTLDTRQKFEPHNLEQQRFDNLTRGEDTWTDADNEIIAWANKVNNFFEEGQRLGPHTEHQKRLDDLTRGKDTWTEGDNIRIELKHIVQEEFEIGQRIEEHVGIQQYFDGIGEVFEQMERTFVDRDNTKITEANAKFNFDNAEIEAVLHELTQEGYDKFGRLLDGFSGG